MGQELAAIAELPSGLLGLRKRITQRRFEDIWMEPAPYLEYSFQSPIASPPIM
jgi:hypothetical protein